MLFGDVTERPRRLPRVDVAACQLRSLDLGKEPLGVDLAVEHLDALLPGRVAVSRVPADLAVAGALLN
jgi:hypothetical protein